MGENGEGVDKRRKEQLKSNLNGSRRWKRIIVIGLGNSPGAVRAIGNRRWLRTAREKERERRGSRDRRGVSIGVRGSDRHREFFEERSNGYCNWRNAVVSSTRTDNSVHTIRPWCYIAPDSKTNLDGCQNTVCRSLRVLR